MTTLWKHPKYGTYYALWNDLGKPRMKSLKTTDPDKARRLFENFKRDLRAEKIAPISPGLRQKLFPFIDEFLDHVSATCAGSTHTLYSVALDKAKASWGNPPLGHITERHFDTLIKDMSRAGLKPPTINKNLRHVKAAIRKGRKWYGIRRELDFPKLLKEKRTSRFLSREQLRALIGKMKDAELADYCLLSGYMGLRSGEILRLTVEDIDNPESRLRVRERKNRQDLLLWINGPAREILKKAAKRAAKAGRKRLFRWNRVDDISHRFKVAARAAGIEWARFHDLRHTFGSHLAMQGTSLLAIKELMGHSTMAATMIYAHLADDHLKEASDSLTYGPMPLKKEGKK